MTILSAYGQPRLLFPPPYAGGSPPPNSSECPALSVSHLPPPAAPNASECPTLSPSHPPSAAPPPAEAPVRPTASPPLPSQATYMYSSPPPPPPSPSAASYPLPPVVRTDPHIYLSPPPPPSSAPPPLRPPPSPRPPALPPPPPAVVKNEPVIYSSPPPPFTRIEPHTYPSPPPPPVAQSPASAPAPAPAPATPPSPIIHRSPPPPPLPHWQNTHRSSGKPRSTNPSAMQSMARARSGDNSSKNIVISKEAATVVVALTGLAVLSFIGAALWFVKQRRRPDVPNMINANILPSVAGSSLASDVPFQRSAANPFASHSVSSYRFSGPPSESSLGLSKLMFTMEELSMITNGFAPDRLLGEGGFGCVYKGVLPNGRAVAVKKLKTDNGHGDREFKAEVDTISRVHHRHLVSLVGYCISDSQRMLIYDFVPNNTLYYHLHGDHGSVLDWRARVKIAAGAARGIAYLHEDCHPWIIHRDIKSSNILLDNKFEALVSDFGLARLAADTNTHVSTRVMGTFGYLAPEYASSGKLTAKSDVYSFGVVLLELITGRKPVDQSQPLGDESLVEWSRPLLMRALDNREFGDLPDPKLGGRFNQEEMYNMMEAAAACIRHSAAMRPRMVQVLRVLDGLSELNLNNGLQPGHSQVFLEPQSEEIRMFRQREFGSPDYLSSDPELS